MSNADDVRSVLKHGHTEGGHDYRHYHSGGDDPHHHRGPGAIPAQGADDVAICICGSGMDPDTWREMRSEIDRLRKIERLAATAHIDEDGCA